MTAGPQLTNFFIGENWPIPHGFTESDVNLSAPKLFSDNFMLYYVRQMGMLGISACDMAITLSARSDVHAYFATCITEAINLYQKAKDLMLEKGLFIRSPYLTPPESIDFVTNQKFLGGWFGENRPLLSIEIAHLYANIQRNALGQSLMMGFSQVAGTKELRKYMVRGKENAAKHVSVFGSKLNEGDLPASVTWDAEVTHSTITPFSDKLMIFYVTDLTAIGIGYYGASLATSLRKDLVTDYIRLTAEVMKYAQDGAKIMIDNGWLEEPPQAANRDQLAKSKG